MWLESYNHVVLTLDMCAREALLGILRRASEMGAPCLFAACVRVQAGEEGDINDGKIEEMMKIIELQISDETKNAVGMWVRARAPWSSKCCALWPFGVLTCLPSFLRRFC